MTKSYGCGYVGILPKLTLNENGILKGTAQSYCLTYIQSLLIFAEELFQLITKNASAFLNPKKQPLKKMKIVKRQRKSKVLSAFAVQQELLKKTTVSKTRP